MPLANKIKYVGCVTLLSVAWLLWFPHPLVPRLWKMQPHLLLCHPVSPGPAEILPTGSLHVQRLCGFFTAKLLQASGSFVGRDPRPLPPWKPQISSFLPGHWAQGAHQIQSSACISSPAKGRPSFKPPLWSSAEISQAKSPK